MPIDPRTGKYHADPLWQRYEPQGPSQAAIDALNNLQMPEPPGSPDKWGPSPAGPRPNQIPFHVQGNVAPSPTPPGRPRSPFMPEELPTFQEPVDATNTPYDLGPGMDIPTLPASPPRRMPQPLPMFQEPVDATMDSPSANRGGMQIPTLPPSPRKWGPTPLPTFQVPVEAKQVPYGDSGGDINQRADAIISDAQNREAAFQGGGKFTTPSFKVPALDGQRDPMRSFGPTPSSTDALATLLGGPNLANQPLNQIAGLEARQQAGPGPFGGMEANIRQGMLGQAAQGLRSQIGQEAEGREAFRQQQRGERIQEQQLRQPMEIAKFQAQAAAEARKQAYDQAMALAAARRQQAMDVEGMKHSASQMTPDLLKMLSGGRPVASYNPTSGAMSFETTAKVPTAYGRDLATLRGKVAQEGETTGWFGKTPSPSKIALDQEVNNIIATHPANDDAKVMVQTLLKQFGTSKGLDEIMDWSDTTPDEEMELRDLWTAIGGR